MACLLAFSMAASPTVPAEAAPPIDQEQAREPFFGGFLRETRIVYPLTVGKRKALNESRFDSPGDGVSVRFAEGADDEWIDVYIYPVGALSPDDVRVVAENEREGLKRHWLQGSGAKQNDLSELRVLKLPMEKDEAARRVAYSLDLTYEAKEIRRHSAMVLAFDSLYMIKARYTTKDPRHSRRTVRRRAESFFKELLPRLTVSSTGGCWQPLPLEKLVAGAAIPEGAVLTISKGDEATEHIFPDRVLTTDPESVSAMASMTLGMHLLNRVHEGCDGAESLNPDVPEGMREIRIDYRAPATDASPVRSPRLQRVGVG